MRRTTVYLLVLSWLFIAPLTSDNAAAVGKTPSHIVAGFHARQGAGLAPREALADIEHIRALDSDGGVGMNLYRPLEADAAPEFDAVCARFGAPRRMARLPAANANAAARAADSLGGAACGAAGGGPSRWLRVLDYTEGAAAGRLPVRRFGVTGQDGDGNHIPTNVDRLHSSLAMMSAVLNDVPQLFRANPSTRQMFEPKWHRLH